MLYDSVNSLCTMIECCCNYNEQVFLIEFFILNEIAAALFFGFLTTLHKSAFHSPESFACGEIKAEATRKDECII